MKKMLFFLVAVAILSGEASAAIINIYVDESGDALFLGATDSTMPLPSGVSIDNGRIAGYTSELTSKQGEIWTFEYFLEGVEIHLILPEGATLKNASSGEIYVEDGQISIYAVDGVKVNYSVEKANPQPRFSFIIAGMISAIILAGLAVYFVKHKGVFQKTRSLDKLEIVSQALNERERLVVDNLKKMGKAKSSFLRKSCDIPKASFSRHIRELEKKGLVKISGEGKNKFVELNY